jgi:DNA-binding transcriptional regulator PaaX
VVRDVEATSEAAKRQRWVLLVYRLPREPSRHRVAVWRKLKTLGALYLRDGVAALPDDAVTREQLEWLQVRVGEAGGEATLWEALPNTVAEGQALAERFRASREEAYRGLIEAATKLRNKAALGADGAGMGEELVRIERLFRAERRRDYFRSPLRREAERTIRAARLALREAAGQQRGAG